MFVTNPGLIRCAVIFRARDTVVRKATERQQWNAEDCGNQTRRKSDHPQTFQKWVKPAIGHHSFAKQKWFNISVARGNIRKRMC
jgi:hypothetical protein